MALVVAGLAAAVGGNTAAGAADGNTTASAAKKKAKKKTGLKVMSRNVYLGADLGPGLSATTQAGFVDAAGEIVNQVDRTNFPLRSQALAQEILSHNPDLVGLQEVAWWRTGPVRFDVNPPKATQTEYDFLQLLLDQLNKNGQRYKPVVVKEEFDFESPVNDQGPPGGAADRNARLTMRDVILARVNKKKGKEKRPVRVSKLRSGTFDTLLKVTPAGQNINVTRGWTALDAKVGSSTKFRFINTHFEAFDSSGTNQTNKGTPLGKGEIRQAQAKSLFAPGGPGDTKLPVVLVGDLNSDDDTVQPNGDHLAYTSLLNLGLMERSTNVPLGCCLSDPNLMAGSLADFDHQVDHVMTDSKAIKFTGGDVTGRAPVGGLWPSDHNGLFSNLLINRAKQKHHKKK